MEQGQCLTKLLNEVAALSLYERLVVQKATTLPPPRIACAQCAAFRSSLITSDIIYWGRCHTGMSHCMYKKLSSHIPQRSRWFHHLLDFFFLLCLFDDEYIDSGVLRWNGINWGRLWSAITANHIPEVLAWIANAYELLLASVKWQHSWVW